MRAGSPFSCCSAQREMIHPAIRRVSRPVRCTDEPTASDIAWWAATSRGSSSAPLGRGHDGGRDGAELAASGPISAPQRPTDRPGVRTVPRDRRVPQAIGGRACQRLACLRPFDGQLPPQVGPARVTRFFLSDVGDLPRSSWRRLWRFHRSGCIQAQPLTRLAAGSHTQGGLVRLR